MSLLLALLLAGAPLADSRGPTEATLPTTVVGEASPSVAPGSGELPMDKLLHASLTANLSLGLTALCRVVGFNARASMLIGGGLALVVGLAKELVWDLALRRGTFDVGDLGANVGGVLAAKATEALFFHAGGSF